MRNSQVEIDNLSHRLGPTTGSLFTVSGQITSFTINFDFLYNPALTSPRSVKQQELESNLQSIWLGVRAPNEIFG